MKELEQASINVVGWGSESRVYRALGFRGRCDSS